MKNLIQVKNLFIRTIRRTQSVPLILNAQPLFYSLLFISAFLFTACQKNVVKEKENLETESATTSNAVPEYSSADGISQQTFVELLKVRAATAKYYNDTLAAVADGYENLNLKLPNMGFHFGKRKFILDGKFDLTSPEFLVYNPDENGVFKLVAVEYGVPMINPQDPLEPQPAGFTGDADVWDPNTLNTGLWTLHAWVWKFNPDGVFKMMNPDVVVK